MPSKSQMIYATRKLGGEINFEYEGGNVVTVTL